MSTVVLKFNMTKTAKGVHLKVSNSLYIISSHNFLVYLIYNNYKFLVQANTTTDCSLLTIFLPLGNIEIKGMLSCLFISGQKVNWYFNSNRGRTRKPRVLVCMVLVTDFLPYLLFWRTIKWSINTILKIFS